MADEELKELPSTGNDGVEQDVDSGQVDNAAPKSVKESLREAVKEVKEKAEVVDDKPSKDVASKLPKEAKPEKVAVEKVAPPESAPAEIKAVWEKLTPEAQKAFNKREADIHKGMTTMDEERKFAKEMQTTITPYMPLINAAGSTPAKAVSEMLNYAHILQTGTPQSKGQLLHQLAQRWGADLRMTPQAAQQPANILQSVQQEMQRLQQQVERQPELIKQQQEEAQLKSVIESFASNPENLHYEKVKPAMAALLSGGVAKDMKDAYDRACYADPEIRSGLEAAKAAESEAKRVADKRAKADAARSAASSIKGLPGMTGAEINNGQKRSLREELAHNLRAVTNH